MMSVFFLIRGALEDKLCEMKYIWYCCLRMYAGRDSGSPLNCTP